MTTACRNEYERPGGRQPGDRIVRCQLDAGHPGDHEEVDTGNTWPQPTTPSPRSARLNLTASGAGSTVEIDGQPLRSVRNLTLAAGIDYGGTLLQLDLILNRVGIGAQTRVELSERNRADLLALGWTPPTEDGAA